MKEKEDTFLLRLLAEVQILDEKIEKLSKFLDSDKSKPFEFEYLSLLVVQLNAMKTYSECLHLRIVKLCNKKNPVILKSSNPLILVQDNERNNHPL